STDSLFNDTVKSVDLTGLIYNMVNLPPATKYYWRVRANNGGHYSESPIWHFTTTRTINTTGIATNSLAGDKPLVFPNPSRDKFTFSNINKGDMIEITDLAGRLIFEGVAKDKSL